MDHDGHEQGLDGAVAAEQSGIRQTLRGIAEAAAARDAGFWIDWSTYAETAYSEFFAADVYPVEATK